MDEACAGPDEWLREEHAVAGIGRLHARLQQRAYARHRHDTYTIALTETGIQEFGYRGGLHRSVPGQVVVLHPDEVHDGRAGTTAGFSYRSLYLDPARVYDATRSRGQRDAALPFVAVPVVDAPDLAAILRAAFGSPLEPLLADEVISAASQALSRIAGTSARGHAPESLDEGALARAREFLSVNAVRVVAAEELERVTGLSRFTLCTQFKRRFGTSPYRYLLMRRLDRLRACLNESRPLADLALQAGFADQAHMTRMFRSTWGITPAAYVRLLGDGRALPPDQ